MIHDPPCLIFLYSCFGRPIIEHASVACFISQVTRIDGLEKKWFTLIAIKRHPWRNTDSILPYKTCCQLLGLETLQNRRLVAQCMFVF